MANQLHIEKLAAGAKAWNAWRNGNPGVIPDFADAKFTLSQRQLAPMDGKPVNLSHANLANAFLYYGTLIKADLSFADLSGANLSYTRFKQANLANTDLTGAMLDEADFDGANLNQARLADAVLTNAKNLTQQQLDQARGNAKTVLPPHLKTPENWLKPDAVKPKKTKTNQAKAKPAFQKANGSKAETGKPKQFVKGHTLNFYSLLNVSQLATQDEIRSAYRRMAKDFHPDLNPENPGVVEEFKLLAAVFGVLSDPQKREHYDMLMAINSDGTTIQSELFT